MLVHSEHLCRRGAKTRRLRLNRTHSKERHQLLQNEVKAEAEEACVSRAVGLRQQGGMDKAGSTMQHKVTWSNVMQADFHCVRFPLQAVYNVTEISQ